jgi:hypothetical protein
MISEGGFEGPTVLTHCGTSLWGPNIPAARLQHLATRDATCQSSSSCAPSVQGAAL